MTGKTVAILGINGHLGHSAARAFRAAGWDVIGFGRQNRYPVEGVRFVAGDARSVDDLSAATRAAPVVVNGLNLPYDKWGNGAAEALLGRVIAASRGKTLLFPGNIYNYRASDRVITPELRQDPETERGAIRMRMELELRAAAERGELRAIVLRAGNFYGSPLARDWFDQLICREADKDRVALNAASSVKNAWAYLPDLADAFVTLAERREGFGAFENFHFAGHFVTADETHAAIERALGRKIRRVGYPWLMLKAMGLFKPVIRGVVEMRYLWEHELELCDERLRLLLGSDFGTSFDDAIAAVVRPFFTPSRNRAA